MPGLPHVTTVSSRLRGERGVVLVEFAIILPVLLMLILGILYFGRYEDYSNQETQLAEEGVRWAAVDNNPTPVANQTLQDYIRSQAQPELANGSSDVSQAKVYLYYPSGSTNTVGSPVTACVVSTVQFPVSLFSAGSATMAQSATMRIEVAATASVWSPNPPPAGTPCPA